jgi:hypothetical protein
VIEEHRMATVDAPDETKLAIVKLVHTVIYVVMTAATIYVMFAGISGRRDGFVWASVALVAFEGVVFFGNGMRCPLTTLAKKYGDPTGHVGDTLFPESCTRYTFRAFGSLYVVGVVLMLVESLAL